MNKNPPQNIASSIMARFDSYLPTLNTGLMDVRVQDAILNYPIVRSLIVPECDLEARRRCISLITKVLNAATPVLPLMLQEKAHRMQKAAAVNANGKRPLHREPTIPVLSQDAQTKLMTVISSMAERDRYIRFWMNHHVSNKSISAPVKPSDKNSPEECVTIVLYTKVKHYKEILSDLADRVQGAICIVFWECWDEIYPTLAEIVGGDEMELADSGRIFRPSGEAAIYINKLKVQRRQRQERERRQSALSLSPPALSSSVSSSVPSAGVATASTPFAFGSDVPSFWTNDTMSTPSSSDSPASIDQFKMPYLSQSQSQPQARPNGNYVAEHSNSILDFLADDKLEKDSLDSFTNLGSLDMPTQHMDLRKRIQLMEEDGYVPEEKHEPLTSIIW